MVLFRNRQWQLTEDGLSTIPGSSAEVRVEPCRLFETRGEEVARYYSWLLHFAEKSWIDIEALIEAFAIALKYNERRVSPTDVVDDVMLKASCDEARAQHAREFSRVLP